MTVFWLSIFKIILISFWYKNGIEPQNSCALIIFTVQGSRYMDVYLKIMLSRVPVMITVVCIDN